MNFGEQRVSASCAAPPACGKLGSPRVALAICSISPIFSNPGTRRHLTPDSELSKLWTMTIDNDAVAEICALNDIARLRVFGSFARGDEQADSDIDLLADFSTRKSLMDIVRIQREFAERLGRSVDLHTERALSPYLKARILDEARVVYERAA